MASKFEKDGEFWFEDGSIILVARNVGFRVFSSLLAAQSPVLADMFSNPSRKIEGSSEGCPVVHLSDSPEDLRHLLRILVPSTQRFSLDGVLESYPGHVHQIHAITRLSHKYRIKDIMEKSLETICAYYTTSFEDFVDSRYGEAKDAIAAINLARVTNTPSILPSAFYACCILGSSVTEGWVRNDGTKEYLTPPDLGLCLEGRDKLARESFSLASGVFTLHPEADCFRRRRCHIALSGLRGTAFKSPDAGGLDVLNKGWKEFWDRARSASLCGRCRAALLRRDKEEHRKVWRKLPGFFNVTVDCWDGEETNHEDDEEDDEDYEDSGAEDIDMDATADDEAALGDDEVIGEGVEVNVEEDEESGEDEDVMEDEVNE